MKAAIYHQVIRFVRHRERQMRYYGARCTMEKLSAIDKIIRSLEDSINNSLPAFARAVQAQEPNLRLLLPGLSSRFRSADVQTVEDILQTCSSLLTNQYYEILQKPQCGSVVRH